MVEKFAFAVLQYLQLAIFAASCFGFGIWTLKLDKALIRFDRIFVTCLAICVGMGIIIVALQLLGILGLLNRSWITGVLLIGIVGLASNLFMHPAFLMQDVGKNLAPQKSIPNTRWLSIALLSLPLIELVLRPLAPPTAWDELMYHLPHARNWALAGKLEINSWVRYPLFPYNFNLLYAAGLIYENDIFSHMAHALAGGLVVVGMYRFATIYFNRFVAILSILLFVNLTKNEFGNAYVDLGVTLFLFFSLSCLFIWYEKREFGFVCLSVFLLGLAAGTKYQALTFVPLVLGAIVWRERRLARLAGLATLFAVPCMYWYVRNYLVSGDPFHPMGGAIFGYWGWDSQDMEYQLADIRRVAGWPEWYLWPAAGALLIISKFRYLPFRATLISGIYAFLTWILTSHYPRYLLPAYPVITLLAALTVHHGYIKVLDFINTKALSKNNLNT